MTDSQQTTAVELTDRELADLERTTKEQMAKMLKWAADDERSSWTEQYNRQARILRKVLKARGGREKRVAVLDYPLADRDVVHRDIGMTDEGSDLSIAYRG